MKWRGDVTHLNNPISRTRSEPLVPRFNRNSPHPSQMTTDDSHQLPLGVVVGLYLTGFSATDEGLGEESGRGVRGGLIESECGGREVVVDGLGLGGLGAWSTAERLAVVLQHQSFESPPSIIFRPPPAGA